MKKLRLFIFPLLLPILLCACTASYRHSCLDMAKSLCECEIGLPAGSLYSFASAPGENGYVSDSMLASLYGNGSPPKECDSWLDFAVFLSERDKPCELAVALCSSSTAALDTSHLFLRRLDVLRVQYGKDYPELINSARVTICGCHVIFVVSSDPENAIRTVRAML